MTARARHAAVLAWLAVAAAAGAAAAGAQPPAAPANRLPPGLAEVGFDQKLGDVVPLDLVFRDESGAEVVLGRCFGARPVILAFAYYRCPMLCTLVLNGLASGLKAVPLEPGRDFELVTVSFDPRDTAAAAAARKAACVERYGRTGAAGAWHFLTGEEAAIHRLTAAAGFRYAYDAEQDQFAHASGVLVLTPDGRISRLLYGIEFAPRDLRLALAEAGQGKVGGLVEQLLLLCFHYDPATGTYGAAALGLVRAGGAATAAGLAFWVARAIRRERRRARPEA